MSGDAIHQAGARVKGRREELTYKHNVGLGRHGWLRLTPAYSVRVVTDILMAHESSERVVDPFSGTATTTLCAAERGHAAVSYDINPFLVWFGNLKLRSFKKSELSEAQRLAHEAVTSAIAEEAEGVPVPPLSNIDRWWSSGDLLFLRCLLHGLRSSQFRSEAARDLALVAFCRTMIGLSNAAFNHQSMSFKAKASIPQRELFEDDWRERGTAQFRKDLEAVIVGAAHNPASEESRVVLADSRHLPQGFDEGADLLITSPPYPNRMSYIRELRPYMYWLGFLEDKREAGELDWKAIGGTWGIATSRVAAWTKATDTYFPSYFPEMLDRIRSADASSGDVLARYVGKYFEDIWHHLRSAMTIIRPGGQMHYIVGNSKFYDVVVPTEHLYKDMLLEAGARQVEIVALRKRNSKKELIEFDVIAKR